MAERWQEIEKLYHSALERRPEDRQAFLANACGADEVLRREVESLLASDELAANFLETTEPEIKKDAREAQIPSGALIGPYTIIEFLRAGGMGEVYKARDTRLGRIVAIKFLPTTIATDTTAIERFQREARAASALNHPRICTIYDVGDHQGRPFIVMEFLAGGSLRDRIDGKPLPIPELLNIAIQICEGLQAAHAMGIIHRDVKPANISVAAGPAVKILDFGVAKVGWEYHEEAAPSGPGSEGVTTKRSIRVTRPGTLTGTLAYLSPEQARGEEVDSRTDIFSLGAVMYEMATGRQPFHGESAAELLNAILTESPRRASESNPTVSRSLERIIEKALAKERSARYQSAEELVGDLRALTASGGYRFLSAASTLALVGLSFLVWFATKPEAGPKARSFAQLTDNPGEELYPGLAPDGKSFVYQSLASGKWEIYLKRVGAQSPISLTKDSAFDDTQPSISPDGKQVVFRSERDGGGIFIMGPGGENVRRLTSFGYNPGWSPDGKEIVCSTGFFIRPQERFAPNAKLFRVNVATGEMRLISGTGDAVQPNWSPHGYRIAYWGNPKGTRDIWTVSAGGGDPVQVTADIAMDWNPVWSRDGRYLYFSSDRAGSMNIWRVRIDEVSGKTSGTPEQFVTPAQYSALISFSADGLHMAYVAYATDANLYKVGFDPLREKTTGDAVAITAGSTPLAAPDFSPDGQWIVFNSLVTPQSLFLVRSDGGGFHQLSDGGQMDRCARWSPDGKQIAFLSARSGKFQVWTIQPDGSGMARHTDETGELGARLPKWLPDGRVLYRTNGPDVIMDPRKPWEKQSLQRLPKPESGAIFASEAWSPDGQLLAGVLTGSDGTFLGLTLYHQDSRRYERIGPQQSCGIVRWLPDGRRLLFLHEGRIYLIDRHSKRIHQVFAAGPRHEISSFGLPADGRRIAFTVEVADADIWLMNLQ